MANYCSTKDTNRQGGRRSALRAVTSPHSYPTERQLVSVCVARLLIRHGTGIALAAARRLVVLPLATSVSVLAFFLLLATGHGGVFAAAFRVAASRSILVVVLRVKAQGHG